MYKIIKITNGKSKLVEVHESKAVALARKNYHQLFGTPGIYKVIKVGR